MWTQTQLLPCGFEEPGLTLCWWVLRFQASVIKSVSWLCTIAYFRSNILQVMPALKQLDEEDLTEDPGLGTVAIYQYYF